MQDIEQVEEKSGSNKVMIIVIVGIVVGLMFAIAVPNLLQTKKARCDPSFVTALRTIVSAQEVYKARTGKYGDYFNLWDGKKNKYIDPVLAKADPDHPQHELKSGYNVDISVNAENSDWCAIATPGKWGEDGARNAIITSDGVIRYNETEGDRANFPKVYRPD